MTNEPDNDPQDTTSDSAPPDPQVQKPSTEDFDAKADQAEDSLEELSTAPALEEDEDSVADPHNS